MALVRLPTPPEIIQGAILDLLNAHSALGKRPTLSVEDQRAMETARKMLDAADQAPPRRDGWPAKVNPGPIEAPITHIG